MKLLTIISFIFLFTVSQYARQFNYLECTLANASKVNAVKCDCEAIFNTSQTDLDSDLPKTQHHFHPSLDQYFISSYTLITEGFFKNIFMLKHPSLPTPIRSGYSGDDFRPPRNV